MSEDNSASPTPSKKSKFEITENKKRIEYDYSNMLGRGGFADVFRGTFDGKPVAIKRLRQLMVSIDAEREEAALRRLDHPNVIRLIHVEKDEDFKSFVLELCDASLDYYFLPDTNKKKYNGPIPSDRDAFIQMAEGLDYIHSEGLVHRDVKPGNVLISITSHYSVLLKWSDFGLSKPVNERGTYTSSGVKGTYDWLAPEILKMMEDDPDDLITADSPKRGTIKSDTFSAGEVFFYLLSGGNHPFGQLKSYSIPSNVVADKRVNMEALGSNWFSKTIIEKMVANESKRISLRKVIEELQFDFMKLEREVENAREELRDIWNAISSKRPVNISLQLDRFFRLLDQGVDFTKYKYKISIKGGMVVDMKNTDVIAALCKQVNLQESARERAVKKLINKGRKVELKSLYNIYKHPKITKNHLITMTDILVNCGGLDLRASYLGYEMNVLHKVCQRYIGPDLTVRIQLLTSRFGISINSQSQTGCNALHFLFRGSLLKIDYRDNKELTECCDSLLEAVTFLVNNGIDVKCEDNQGRNPLFYFFKIQDYEPVLFSAIKGFRTKIVDILLQKEPGIIYFIDKNGKTILHAYCEESFHNNFLDYLQLLIDKGISINALDNRGFNALHCLFQNNRLRTIEVVKSATIVLLNNGINAKFEDEVGRNPLFHLYDNYSNYFLPEQVCGEITELLIQRGVDINATDKDGTNILHLICDKHTTTCLVEIIGLLIKKGIKINALTKKGFNALHLLCNRDWFFVTRYTEQLFCSAKLLIGNGILDFDFGPSTSLRESFFYLFSYFTAHKFNIDQVDFTSFESYVNDFRTESQSNMA